METVLVTGGAGFIGSWTVELLVKKGYSVVVLDNLVNGSIDNISGVLDKIVFVEGDILDRDLLKNLFKKYSIESVIHLAALTSVEESYKEPMKYFRVNVEGTLYLLEEARRNDVERFVYASSAAVYGDPRYIPIDEEHPINPVNFYGASKASGELLVNTYWRNYGLSTISLRYFNVYGPRMKKGPYSGVIYKFIERALNGEPFIIYGDGLQTRDFIYVEDVARANIIALESRKNGVYNIGTGKSVSIKELAYTIAKLLGIGEPRIVYEKPRLGDIRHSCASIEKAIKDLMWSPRVELVDGLSMTIKYFSSFAR